METSEFEGYKCGSMERNETIRRVWGLPPDTILAALSLNY